MIGGVAESKRLHADQDSKINWLCCTLQVTDHCSRGELHKHICCLPEQSFLLGSAVESDVVRGDARDSRKPIPQDRRWALAGVFILMMYKKLTGVDRSRYAAGSLSIESRVQLRGVSRDPNLVAETAETLQQVCCHELRCSG